MFKQLPDINRAILVSLSDLSACITQRESINRMNFSSLGIVFAPCLLRNPSDDPIKLLENTKHESRFITAMLHTLAAHAANNRASPISEAV